LSPIRFTRGELEQIAATAISLKHCEHTVNTLDLQLLTRNEKICNMELLLLSRDTTIAAQDSIISTHEEITSLKDEELVVVKSENETLNKKLKRTKMAWVGSIAGIIILWVLTVL